jgi:RNA polymerase sigma factor (sigma-70 family)
MSEPTATSPHAREQPANPIADLLHKARAGCSQSAQILCDRYAKHIIWVIRRRLDERLRPLFDSVDFVQEVWLAVFSERFQQACQSEKQFLAFLMGTAERKVLMANRKYLDTQKTSRKRQVPLDSPAVCPDRDLQSREPAPHENVQADELWERIRSGAGAKHQVIVELLRLGDSFKAIADAIGLSEKTIRRVVAQLEAQHLPTLSP